MTIFWCAEGDSITAGGGFITPYPQIYASTHPEITLHTSAVGGSQLSNVVGRISADDALIAANPGYDAYVLSLHIGINDHLNFADLTTFLLTLLAYCDGRRAAGWKVVLTTQISEYLTSDATYYASWVAWRGTYNPTVEGWVGVHVDAIADLTTTALGPDTAANDNIGVLYEDYIHPNTNGHILLAPVIGGAVSAIAEPPVLVYFPEYAFKNPINGYGGTDTRVGRDTWTRLDDVINVKDYGATGNGVTDDTAAINEAIFYGHELGATFGRGAIIYFPPGTYYIGTPPLYFDVSYEDAKDTVGALLHFEGAGWRSSIITGNYGPGGQAEAADNGFLVQCGVNLPGFRTGGPVESRIIRDLAIINTSTSNTSGAIIFAETGNVQIRNCYLKGFNGLVGAYDSFNAEVRDCVIECSRPITSANAAVRSPLFDYNNFQAPEFLDPVTFLPIPPTRLFGSIGLSVAQTSVIGCTITGFDIGMTHSEIGQWAFGNTISRCGIGIMYGWRTGHPAGSVDGLPIGSTGGYGPGGGAGTAMGNRIDRCTWGISLLHVSIQTIIANTISGSTGPYEPAAISNMTWSGSIVTVTSAAHNIVNGSMVQITPASWTNNADGFVTALFVDANTFAYFRAASTPSTFDPTSTWNYPIEYGITADQVDSCFLAANWLSAAASLYSFDLTHPLRNTASSNLRNEVWAMTAPYGWGKSPAVQYKNQGWNYLSCDTSNMVTFAEIIFHSEAPTFSPQESMEYTVTDCQTQTAWNGIVSAGGSGNHYLLRHDGTNWRRIG